MKIKKCLLVSVAPVALAFPLTVHADTLDSNPFIETSGGGFIYVDTTEGVEPPGIKAVTFTSTRNPEGEELAFVEPYDNFVTDFSALKSRGEVTNCLMANNTTSCDSAPGSGKRIKNYLTGMDPFDTRFRTSTKVYTNTDTNEVIDTSLVDYFTFGKISNFTGARITGLNIEVLDKDGKLMDPTDPANAVLFNTAATKIGLGASLTDGLFGNGGQEGEDEASTGFFVSGTKAVFTKDAVALNKLEFGALTLDGYTKHFGEGYLDNTMVPDGMFWDYSNGVEEAALVAWNNLAGGGWTYGNLTPIRLQALAASLGVDVSALAYASGELVPAEILAAAKEQGFEVLPIEDLRNANLNYTMSIGNIDGNEFVVRISKEFAPIVANATTEMQLKNAIYLDTLANVPYLNTVEGSAEKYQAAIESLIAEGNANDVARALESVGFGHAPAFTSIGFETARDQVAAITRYVPWSSNNGNQKAASNDTGSWSSMDSDLYGFVSPSLSRSEYDPLSNALGYDVDVYSLTAGIEKRLTNTNSSVGLAVGYTDATAKTHQDFGEIEADGYSVAAFTRTRFGEGGLVQALVGYQDLSYESKRDTFEGDTATGKTDGTQVFAALSVDYLKNIGAFKIGPTASIEYYDVSVDGFTENGTDIWNLAVGDQDSNILRTSIGVLGEYQFPTSNTRLLGSVKYTNVSGDDLNIQTGIVGQARSLAPYTVQGMDKDLVNFSIGLDHVIKSNDSSQVALYGGYNGKFGSDYDNQGIQIGINSTF